MSAWSSSAAETTMPEVFIGFGSNIEPLGHLRSALAALHEHFGEIECSSVFRSPAYGFDGDDFLNLVGVLSSDAGPEAVEAVLTGIEDAGGRVRSQARFAARSLDLDLLAYGACVAPKLRLPREDILRYPFVLAPLAELAPSFRHPVVGVRAIDAWEVASTAHPELRSLGRLQDVAA